MDDIDVGVNSLAEGRTVLRDLDLALQTRQIRLNSGKTRILSEAEARRHFKIRENSLIDKLADNIAAKIAARVSTAKEKMQVELGIRAGLRRGSFAFGNGEKIFKRLLNLARQIRAEVNDDHFVEIPSPRF